MRDKDAQDAPPRGILTKTSFVTYLHAENAKMRAWLLSLVVVSASAYRLYGRSCRCGVPEMRAQTGLKLATDIKGNLAWDLRIAGAGDAANIAALTGGKYPSEVCASLLAGGNCVVGESGGTLVTAALVTAFKGACACTHERLRPCTPRDASGRACAACEPGVLSAQALSRRRRAWPAGLRAARSSSRW